MADENSNSPDSWNPMKEAYCSPSFNSYNRGPGASLPLSNTQDHSDSTSGRTLYVVGIPEDLKESGLRELFSQYGKVLNVSKGVAKSEKFAGKCFGFVEFSTTVEAQKAMNNLNGKAPLQLNMKFAIPRHERQKREQIIAEDKNKLMAKIAVNQPSVGLLGRNEKEKIQVTVSQSSDKHHVTCHRTVDTVDGASISSQSSFSMSEGNLKMCSLTQHKLSMKDKCELCQDEIPHTHLIRVLRKDVIVESVFLDNFEPDDHKRQCCLHCSSPGKMMCCGCQRVWYCSNSCAKMNWPEHKNSCLHHLASEKTHQNGQSSQNSFPLKPRIDNACGQVGVPTSRQLDGQQHLQSMNRSTYSKVNAPHDENDNSCAEKISKNKKIATSKVNLQPKISASSLGSVEGSSTMKYDIPSETLKGKPHEVVLVFVSGPGYIWLQKVENTTEMNKLWENLQLEARKNILLKERPIVGDYCITQFSEDKMFYRAQVKEILRDKCKVQYIDFGNEEVVKISQLHCLPPYLATLPAQAICCALDGIKLEPPKPIFKTTVCQQIKELLSGKLTATFKGNLEDGRTVVELKNHLGDNITELLIQLRDVERLDGNENNNKQQSVERIMAPAKSPSDLKCLKSLPKMPLHQSANDNQITCTLRPFITTSLKQIIPGQGLGFIVFINDHQKIMMGCDVPDYHRAVALEKDLLILAEKFQGEKFVPCKHDFVAAYSPSDKSWYRALVLSVIDNVFKVFYLDYGNEEVVENVIPLCPEHISCPSALLHCTPAENLSQEQTSFLRSLKESFPTVFFVKSVGYDCVELAMSKSSGTIMIGHPWYYGIDGLFENRVQPSHHNNSALQTSRHPAQKLLSALSVKGVKGPQARLMANSVKQRAVEAEFVGQVLNSPTLPPVCLHIVSEIDTVNQMMTDLEKQFKTTIAFKPYIPHQDEMVCLRSSADQRFYRGKVESIRSMAANVYFVDYGRVEEAPFDQLHPLPEAFQNYPFFAIGVELDGVPQEYIDSGVHSVLEAEPWKVQVTSWSDPIKVKLFSANSENICLNTILLQPSEEPEMMPVADVSATSECTGRVYYSSLPLQHLSSGQDLCVYVTHVETPTDIFCVPLSTESTEILSKVVEETDRFGQLNSTQYFPEPREVCLVYREDDDDAWCRATVLSVENDWVCCLLIDLGMIDRVKPKNIRRLPRKLSTIPRLVIHCSLAGLPEANEWEESTIQALKTFLPVGSETLLKITKMSDTVDALVAFPNFTLHDIGL